MSSMIVPIDNLDCSFLQNSVLWLRGTNVSYWTTVDTDIDLANSNPVLSTLNEFDWIKDSKLL